jgi:hypothetical protein
MQAWKCKHTKAILSSVDVWLSLFATSEAYSQTYKNTYILRKEVRNYGTTEKWKYRCEKTYDVQGVDDALTQIKFNRACDKENSGKP